MSKIRGAVVVNTERCKGCNLCVVACPTQTLALTTNEVNHKGYVYSYEAQPDTCIGCSSCAIVCPDGCITVYKKGPTPNRTPEATPFTPETTISDTPEATECMAKKDTDSSEVLLMKGNEAIAHAAIRCGCDGYFGYPITPQSEVLETLAELKPWETTGMVVLQAESEVASINMLYGGGGTGKRVMTSSSSVGIALMQEGISYMAGAEVPGLIVNVQRGGPGLGTIQPSQSDYNQATRGGGNGDYNVIVLAPNSVQEMADFVDLGFNLAFKYRNPVMILSDGVIGQMMEKVVLPPYKPRRTAAEIQEECPWAANGNGLKKRGVNVITSLELEPANMEIHNLHLQQKYNDIKQHEVRYETIDCENADYLIVAFGSAARISQKAISIARKQGLKVGLFRPVTLWPFPEKEIRKISQQVKGILTVEINAGQMVYDVRAAVEGKIPVNHFGRLGGIVPDPDEIVEALKQLASATQQDH